MPTVAPVPNAASDEQARFFAGGIPVEIGKIQKELKKLWQNSDHVATRASRLNLVVYSAAAHSIRANTALVAEIARQHALRAILIANKPAHPGEGVRAWVNAHCQLSKTGAKQRCSEQIAFQFQGKAADFSLIPNVVFGHLDSDLPLYLWWQGDFPQPAPGEQLLAWVDRLLFDSADWSDARAQFAVLREICAANPRLKTALGDLDWTRLITWRSAIAQFFDLPGRHDLAELDRVEITHAPTGRLTALLLLGWLALRLGWQAEAAADGSLVCKSGAGAGARSIAVTLREGAAAGSIQKLTLGTTGGAQFCINRGETSDFFNTRAQLAPNEREHFQVLRAGSEKLADLVSEELTHSGNHRVYLRVLDVVERLLPAAAATA
ncbi:MAG: glucose-6-phosphate dehydrogenase assembly protein OpcA [Verrucomicrobia bacterium]|nr:glucose-6-phosphate dehydrogenase assembly protein OpcA [Verrucomicrobiota bacterium]MBV9658974.1 glucose-6-phosphate dehydrogenase assembly protein OpcA [Verrucomicrobiota bacterium]